MENLVETKLYIAKITDLKNKEAYNKAYASVDIERKKKVDSMKFQQGKLQSLAAGVLLVHALQDVGLDITDAQFECNEFGKPYIKNSDIFFNLSHSGDYAICAVSNSEIGCDIEKIVRTEDKIAKKFFCQEEYLYIASQPNEQARKEEFYRYWTLKESFIKAIGLGLKLHLNSFQIVLGNKISIKQSVNDKDYSFYEYNGLEGYKCSVCAQNLCSVNIRKLKF